MNRNDAIQRRLIDRIRLNAKQSGEVVSIVAATHDLDPDFFEHDFLPTVLGIPNAEDHSFSGRIAVQRKLAACEFCGVLVSSAAYQGRPSLRTTVRPVSLPGARLHAKVVAIAYEHGVRLVAGSANLTVGGYRHNREVVGLLEAWDGDEASGRAVARELATVRAGIAELPFSGSAEYLATIDRMVARLPSPEQQDGSLVWSSTSRRLHTGLVQRWPASQPVERVVVVSPFWSEDGSASAPLRQLLTALKARAGFGRSCKVELIMDAARLHDGTQAVAFPAGFCVDCSDLGTVDVSARAADPTVDPAELDVKVDLTAARMLHAKVVVVCGGKFALAYAGSGNFTRSGWGFSRTANAEAGWILEGDARSLLASLIPKTVGASVTIRSAELMSATACLDSPELGAFWPSWLTDAELEPTGPGSSELHLRLAWSDAAPDGFAITTVPHDDVRGVELVRGGSPAGAALCALDRRTLHQLLVDREVLVTDLTRQVDARFPINLAPGDARLLLPIAPNAARPGEQALLAYYQGRLTFEELYPDPLDPVHELKPGPRAVAESGVDTTRIQSYQVREFVNALPGMVRELTEVRGPRAVLDQAFLGEVSPVALARLVRDEARTGRKTATAAAFQLTEIRRAVCTALRHVDGRDPAVLEQVGSAALDRIASLIAELKANAPGLFERRGAFDRYEQRLRKEGSE